MLAFLLGVSQHEAQGVTLAAAPPIGLPAVLTYHRVHPIRLRLTAFLLLGFLPGAWAGAQAASLLPERPLRAPFVLLLLHFAWTTSASARGSPRQRGAAAEANALWIGALAGLFGVGGGIILVKFLVSILGLSQHEAQGTSLCGHAPPRRPPRGRGPCPFPRRPFPGG